MKRLFYFIVLLSGITLSQAVNPESTYVFSHGTMRDGVYLSFQEFKENSPSFPFPEAKIIKTDTTSYHLSIASIHIEGKPVKKYKRIWAVVEDGIPYIHYIGTKKDRSFGVNADAKGFKPGKNNPLVFYRMDVYGHVCLFALEHVQRLGMPKSYSRSTIPKGIQFVRHKALDLRTGQIHDLTPGYVWELVKDDAFVLEVLNSDYNTVNLVQIVELYNRRNPLFPVANNDHK